MGWAGGVNLLDDVWSIIEEVIPEPRRWDVACKLAQVFAEYDADDLESSHYRVISDASHSLRASEEDEQ